PKPSHNKFTEKEKGKKLKTCILASEQTQKWIHFQTTYSNDVKSVDAWVVGLCFSGVFPVLGERGC
ncbi:Hypothetical predicted protein, partial [Marmota monax]